MDTFPSLRWNWTAGPFGYPQNMMTAGQPSYWPSQMATDVGLTPSSITQQAPPHLLKPPREPPMESPLYPPTRSVEPWTEEQWYWQFPQPSNNYYWMTGGLVTAGYYQWTPYTMPVPGGPAWAPQSYPPTNPTIDNIKRMSFGVQVYYQQKTFMRQARFVTRHTICPREMFSERCTPMDAAISPNDTCRQATLWPDFMAGRPEAVRLDASAPCP